jgi:hypothetical protein
VSQYLFSIVRFKIPTQLHPLFFFPTFPLIVTIFDGTSYFSRPVLFISSNNDNLYVNGVYSYQLFCNMINNAITLACTDASIAYPLPFIVYDTQQQIFKIYFPTIYISTGALKLFFNTTLFNYFGSFPNISFNNSLLNLNANYQILCLDTLINKVAYPPNNAYPSFMMSQEWQSFGACSSLSSIVITSNNIGVVNVNSANIFLGSSNTANNKALSIIEDFEIVESQTAGYQSNYQTYTSQNNRYSDLYEKNSLYNINLQVFAFAQELNLYQPIYIAPQFNCTFKLMFKRKIMNY